MEDYAKKGPFRRNRERVQVSERTKSTGWYTYGEMELCNAIRILERFSPGSWVKVVFLQEPQPSELEVDIVDVVKVMRERLDAKFD